MGSQEETIVARFASMSAAQQAMNELGSKDEGVQRGAVLLRDESGSVYIQQLGGRGLKQVAKDGAGLGLFLVSGGLGIAVVAAASTANLLLRGTGRALELAGSVAKVPLDKVQDVLHNPKLNNIGATLATGGSALVVEVDADKAAEMKARLVAQGATLDPPAA